MKPLKVDLSYVHENYLKDYNKLLEQVKVAHKQLGDKTGKGSDFLGWLDLPKQMVGSEELARIKRTAKRLTDQSDIILVIGIGGSYLGAKAVIEALDPYFDKTGCEVIFVGHHISSTYMAQLLKYLENKSFSINVISKSGTTTEPALAFRVFKDLLESKVGKAEASKRIVATTDKEKGALRHLAEQEGYETFIIEDDIGGRYSVLTAVGLLPIACRYIDVDALLNGALNAYETLSESNDDNEAYRYVIARNALYRNGKKIEMLVHYEPSMMYVAEWWKQLYGESEGKDLKGIFPASANFTTDLHSLGQYIQDGERHLFETVISIENVREDFKIEKTNEDLDGLNFLAGASVDYVNKQALIGTLLAHNDGDVPNILIRLEKLDAFNLGYMLYFYELSCALSGYLLQVNPFDQPGVEAYKKNMFALLEKPGFEEATKAIKKRLK
ncbi:glucose-6-phosphate isomerase [Liberiplasma polymorphum]|uniref:glucose-6-phosphate isomerase n=1 Tax=Liberiplasma polymorphum TaxID=3374570 RepID=UPI003770875A